MSNTTYFYDGQIRRYLIQIIRLMSNFAVKYGDGTLVRVPVAYGDADRQAAAIINQNSENTVQSAPKIAVYMSDLELDPGRLSDSSYVGKVNIRERGYNEATGEYENYQGNSYTVERLMPTPYKLTVKVDIWSTSNEQKLQILEQILMLFNPSLEIQTTDNYLDWTSLSVVDLTQVTLSSRTIPVGTGTEIDIATLTMQTPIWISPPAKVKRLGVVTSIISNIFTQVSEPYGGYIDGLGVDPEANSVNPSQKIDKTVVSIVNYDIEVISNAVRIIGSSSVYPSWEAITKKASGNYTAGLSRIYIEQLDGNNVVGYFSINPLDSTMLTVNWDGDTYPSNSQILSNNRTSSGTFDAVLDPKKTGPNDPKLPALTTGSRYLIVDNIGGGIVETYVAETKVQRINTNTLYKLVSDHKVFVDNVEVGSGSQRIPDSIDSGDYYIILDQPVSVGSIVRYELYVNTQGPTAWENLDGSDFVARENDIIEWTGTRWSVVFDSINNANDIIYLTNIFTSTQYKWDGVSWSKSFEGIYRKGSWHIEL
jgi:hypothetical protein